MKKLDVVFFSGVIAAFLGLVILLLLVFTN